MTTGGTEVADTCRFKGRLSRVDDTCTESERNDILPARGGIAGGGPLETTEPWDCTRPGSTGAFVLGGSEPLIDAGRGGILGVDFVVVVVVAATIAEAPG